MKSLWPQRNEWITALLVSATLCSGSVGADHEIERGNFPAYLLNCTNQTDNQMKALNLTFSLASMLSLFILSLVLMVILHHQVYKTVLQKAFLCLIVVTETRLVVISMTIMHWFQYTGDETLCKLLGFTAQYTGALAKFLDVAIALILLGTVYRYLIRSRQPLENKTKYYVKCFEWMLFITAIISPFSYVWYPFVHGGYGFSGISCWIKSYDKQCNYVGFKSQLLVFSVYLGHDIIIILAALVLAVTYCVYGCQKFQNAHVAILVRKTLLLMVFIVSRAVVNVFLGILYRFYIESYAYSFIYATTYVPLSLLTIPIGYLVYLFANNSNQGSRCRCCCRRKAETQHLIRFKNLPPATPLNLPSTTVSPTLIPTGIGVTTTDGHNPQREENDTPFLLCCFTTSSRNRSRASNPQSNADPTNRLSTRVSARSTTVTCTLVPTGIGMTTDDNESGVPVVQTRNTDILSLCCFKETGRV